MQMYGVSFPLPLDSTCLPGSPVKKSDTLLTASFAHDIEAGLWSWSHHPTNSLDAVSIILAPHSAFFALSVIPRSSLRRDLKKLSSSLSPLDFIHLPTIS